MYTRYSGYLGIMFKDLFDWLFPRRESIRETNAHMRRVLAKSGNFPRPRLTCPK